MTNKIHDLFHNHLVFYYPLIFRISLILQNEIHKNQAKETYQTMHKSMYDELWGCQENTSIHILLTFLFSHDMLMFVTLPISILGYLIQNIFKQHI